MARQHRGYLLECRREDGFSSTRTSHPVQRLLVLLRVRVVCGVVRWLGVGASVINLEEYKIRVAYVCL